MALARPAKNADFSLSLSLSPKEFRPVREIPNWAWQFRWSSIGFGLAGERFAWRETSAAGLS